ncbi:Long-chain acyl-CoA synthetase (AMP-forming) [Marinobacter sp. DSM 26671]|jgi:long-subunit acyl-CoA synthetase (AMP-forming)|uniref:AMP-binding protein n=2 Tax=Marinobacter adhaerens TaxID=1033846 RepID=A0ABX8IBU9_9GAMM|nr:MULTISPECIES: AMP-binding protein [Marinobacter]MCR9189901.1 AMP-binding protein [Alteromonadaceae bacterium]MCW8868591.1 AMP-binding protein [Marinobacter sp.]MBW4978822.1 AMP-binding protein [Marinobacter adhaerens]MTI77096.1 AMP-binding protein [Marinobacter sp.]PHS48457.1 MAG: AMP-binding acetyl-CoA synthetase [Marinobacter sp.]
MDTTNKLPLDMVYHWEKAKANSVYMTQPIGDGKTVDYTWGRAVDEARRMASYLKSLNLPEKSRIGLISKNCAHWIMTDWAIWMAGHISVPLYPTLNADTVNYILNHAECEVVFVGKLDDWDMMKPGVPESVRCISFPLSPPNDFETWDDIVAKYPPLEENVQRDADELATIVYTSGSTGKPKGVMLSFYNMAYAAEGGMEVLGVSSEERMLSYLPLAHVFERTFVELASLYAGFHLYFAESLDTFVQDLQRAQPTLFLSVPRLWVKFQHGVLQKLPKKKLDRLLKIPVVNKLIKKKILKGLGLDKVKLAGSGSAPLASDVLDWYRNLGLELLEGYGMSENFAYSHMSKPGRSRTGYVGESAPGVETRISPEGEIQIKSPATMMGYYKDEEKTRETFTEDGFLKTGDKGEIDEMGRLKITGRIKEIFKTSKGKYIAPAPIENRLMSHDAIEMVCVSGANQTQPHALVMLAEESRPKMADEAFRKEIEESFKKLIADVNKTVDPHEQLAFITVMSDEWSIENSFLTPTMKLKRNVVEDAYQEQVENWYAQRQPVIWQ